MHLSGARTFDDRVIIIIFLENRINWSELLDLMFVLFQPFVVDVVVHFLYGACLI